MRRRSLILALILLSLLCSPIYAEEQYLVLEGKGARVFYEAPVEDMARALLAAYPAASEGLEETFGWRAEIRPDIVVVRGRDEFRRMTSSDLTVAFANTSKNLIVVDGTNINIKPFTLEETLRHEVCHIMLGMRVGPGDLPRWLDEGLCQWASGGYSEVAGLGKGSALTKAALFKSLIPLRRLNKRFPADRNRLLLAYEQSRSVVEYIHARYGARALPGIISALRAGYDIDSALGKVLRVDLEGLERAWHAHLKNQHTWLTFLANNIYTVVFALGALVLVLGFIRVMIRIRTYRDEDGDEEDFPNGTE